jgi:DNA repair protein RadC
MEKNEMPPMKRLGLHAKQKFQTYGSQYLSDEELLELILSPSTKKGQSYESAKSLMAMADGNLSQLAKLDYLDFQAVEGVNLNGSLALSAGLELARRRLQEPAPSVVILNHSEKVFQHFKGYFLDLDHEEFMVAMVNNRNELIHFERISIGGITSTIVDVRLIIRKAIMRKALGFFLMHNHPSGNIIPSSADKELTAKLKKGAELFDITLIDHIIFANHRYYSFADEGKM